MTSLSTKKKSFQLISSIFFIIIYPLLIIYLGTNCFWLEGWIFLVWFVFSFSSIFLYLYFKNPDLLAERFKGLKGDKSQKKWDKYFFIVFIPIYTFWFVIIPLDAQRYLWTEYFPLYLKIIGAVFLIDSYYFYYRSFTDNTFASPLIRIQKERNQTVVSSGVYSFIRHPMYLGAILMFIGTPMLLGSLLGLFISLVLSFLFILRIIGEEKMLEEELEGYKEYKQKVKYRLIPYIW